MRRLATPEEIAEVTAALSVLSLSPGWQITTEGASRVRQFLAGQDGSGKPGTPLAFWWDDDEADDEETYQITEEGVAIIPVHGVLVDSTPSWWMSWLGYCSTPQIADWIAAASLDANVKDILLDIDSPGGQASGLAASADAIFQVRQAGEKRVWSACREVCSAAYHLGSQAEKMFLTQDGAAGCIGTVYGLYDWSGYYGQMGVKALRITNKVGKAIKGMGMRGSVVTKEQQDDLGRICDEFQAIFDTNVARGRGIDLETAQSMADGRWYIGANALGLGLVDEILPVEDVLARLGTDADSDGAKDPVPTSDPIPGAVRATIEQLYKEQSMDEKEQSAFARVFATAWNAVTGKGNEQQAPPAPTAPVVPVPPTAEPNEQTQRLQVFYDKELTTAKKDAKALALTAFGQGSEALTRAEKAIDAMTEIDNVRDMASAYKGMTPPHLQEGNRSGERQTEGDDPAKSTLVTSASRLADDKIEAARKTGEKALKSTGQVPAANRGK